MKNFSPFFINYRQFFIENFLFCATLFPPKVVGEDGHAVGPNEIGEIYLLSQIRFLGYANQPEETRNAFDEQGWFKTGDLGYFNEECELFLVDRKKEMIKYLNYQVAPSELEIHISRIEGIVAVCVVGIKDILSGDLPAAVVVKQANSSLEEIDILDEVARKSFKIYY